ncbi:LytTR family transcriptional regulator DNA-binding domain-containing protein [Paenibacillus sp. FSL K6-1318]|uniref:LytTR family transcriptional regulator DNA-binding domain-containing protein n=1 Tax=Paenibacillus sp. FSL K6-1318 TaxID=2975291 RepID=UPI0030EDCB5D
MYELKELSVTKERDGKSGGTNIPIKGITHLEADSYMVIVHTAKEHYYLAGTMVYWVNTLNASGYKFRNADRSNIINVENIRSVDMNFKLAYFENDVNKQSKKCTFVKDRLDAIIEEFPQIADKCSSGAIFKTFLKFSR